MSPIFNSSINQTATIVIAAAVGGKKIGDAGYFVEPTVLVDVKPQMKVVQEEIRMMSHADNSILRWSCNQPGHEHQSWEEADCCDLLLPLLAQLQCGSGDTGLSYALSAIAGDYVATTLMVNPDETYSRIYAQLRELYESAGRPEGEDEAGLWRWIGKICMP